MPIQNNQKKRLKQTSEKRTYNQFSNSTSFNFPTGNAVIQFLPGVAFATFLLPRCFSSQAQAATNPNSITWNLSCSKGEKLVERHWLLFICRHVFHTGTSKSCFRVLCYDRKFIDSWMRPFELFICFLSIRQNKLQVSDQTLADVEEHPNYRMETDKMSWTKADTGASKKPPTRPLYTDRGRVGRWCWCKLGNRRWTRTQRQCRRTDKKKHLWVK